MVIELPEQFRTQKTTGWDRDNYNAITDICIKTGESFHDVVNDVVRRGLETLKEEST